MRRAFASFLFAVLASGLWGRLGGTYDQGNLAGLIAFFAAYLAIGSARKDDL